MKILLQVAIMFGICLGGEAIASMLPISFPASVIGMIILFLFLLVKFIKPHHIKEKSDFLLKNMAFFFVPAGVGILKNYDLVKGSIIKLLIICIITTIITFVVTAYTIQGVVNLQNRRRKTNE